MNPRLQVKFELAAALCGPLFVIGYIIFWAVLGHNVPPPSPGYSAQELVANYYGKYHDDILLGMVGCAIVGILYLPWCAQLAVQMKRVEGDAHILSNIELLGGGITAWLLAECPAIWALAASEPTSNPDLVQLTHRHAWFVYDLTYLITTVEMVACGVFALVYSKSRALFPAWAGWVAIIGGVSFLPLCAIAYVTSGPFALNGGWNFFFVFGIWLFWFSTYTVYMLKDILKRLQDKAPAHETAPFASGALSR